MRFLICLHTISWCVQHTVSTIFWKDAYKGLNILPLRLEIKQVVGLQKFLLADAEIDFCNGYIGVVEEFGEPYKSHICILSRTLKYLSAEGFAEAVRTDIPDRF